MLATVNWISTQSGNWNVGSNWSTGQVPGPGDDVVINVSGASPTVTIDSGSQTVNSLQSSDPLSITGGSLTLEANSEIDGALTFGAGATLATEAVLTLTGSDTWTGGTLAGVGSVDLTSTGTLALSGTVAGALSTSLTNAGTITIGGTGGLTVSGAITNSGTLTDNSTATVTITTPFVNQGATIDVESGTLSVQSVHSTWTGGGTLDAAAGATLQLAPAFGGDNGILMTGTYTGSGGGAVELTTGALEIGSSGATFDFPKGLFQWQGGSISDDLAALANTGFLTLNNSSGITLSGPSNFINQGKVDQTGAGNLTIASGTFDNQSGATYDLSGTGGVTGAGTFSVEGTVKMTGTGTAALSVLSALNGGTIDVASGTLLVQSTDCAWTGGNLEVASGATLQLAPAASGEGITLTGTYTGSGGGTVALTQGNLNIGSAGATFNFPQGLFQWQGGTLGSIDESPGTLTNAATGFIGVDPGSGNSLTLGAAAFAAGGTIDVQSGTLLLADGSVTGSDVSFTVAEGATVNLNGPTYTGNFTGSGGGTVGLFDPTSTIGFGTLSLGSGGATFNFQAGMFQWDGGFVIGPGSITNSGAMTLDGAGDALENGAVLVNSGTLTVSGNGETITAGTVDNSGLLIDNCTGPWVLNNGLVLQNESGGTVNINSSQSIQASGIGGGSIENDFGATFQVNGTAPSVTAPFDEQGGTIGVNSGTSFTLAGGGTSTGGIFSVSGSSSTLVLGVTDKPLTLSGTYTGTGAGTVAIAADNSLIFGNTGATFNFPGSMLQWTAGGIEDISGGDLTNLGTITFAGTAAKFFGKGSTLENKGTIIQTGTGDLELSNSNPDFPTTLQNDAGALYEIEGDSSIVTNGQMVAIDNAGIIKKTGGSGTSTIAVNDGLSNTGTIEADSGTLALSATIAQVSGSTLTAGTWNALGGSTIQFPTGTGLTANQADVTLSGAGASMPALANLATNAETFSVLGGATFTTPGNLSNTGTVTVGPASTLAVGGNYTQAGAGTLEVQLGGAPASGRFGQLAVTGSATLGGTLQSDFVSGYSPNAGDSFRIISFASASGSFAATDTPTFHGGNLFQAVTNPTNITFTAAASVANLEVTSVSASPNPVETAQNLTVNYSVENTGNATAVSSWVDSVFLSSTATINSSAVLLGRVAHTGAVAANGTYSGTLTAAVPAIPPGNCFIVVEVDSRGLVPDADRATTVLATTSPILVTLPSLSLGAAGGTPTPAAGTVDTNTPVVYAVADPTGASFNVELTASAIGDATVLAGYQSIPTQSSSVFSLEGTTSPAETTVVTGLVQAGQSGTYFVEINWPGPASSAHYSLSASEVGLSVSPPDPSTAPAADDVTIGLSGSGFTPDTSVSLVSGATTIPAEQVVFDNAYELSVTFDLANAAVGNYAFKVSNDGQSASTAQGFAIFSPPGSTSFTQDNNLIIATLEAPSAVRPGHVYSLIVDYYSDAPEGFTVQAPILELSAENVEFELPGQTTFTPDSVLLLGIDPSGEAGVLPGTQGSSLPPQEQSITVDFIATTTGSAQFSLGVADPTGPIDWSSVSSTLQPSDVSDAAWSAIFTNFTDEVGNTVGGLQSALDNDANYLSQLGIYTPDAAELVQFQLEQAGDFGAIAQRYTAGIFGLGVPDPTLTAITDPQGNVDITAVDSVEPFTLEPDGTYEGELGDFSTLTLTGGIYQLRQPGGVLEVFNPNGTLSFVEDTDGDKTLYGYTGSQLTSITDTARDDVTSFTYNAEGFVNQVTDPEGQDVTLTYDSAGHLLTATTPLGTTSYTYVTSGTPQQLNALASITNPDGSQIDLTYNSQGQVVAQSENGGAELFAFSYDVGAITATDPLGDISTEFLDNSGQVVRSIDPLGNVTQAGVNSAFEPT